MTEAPAKLDTQVWKTEILTLSLVSYCPNKKRDGVCLGYSDNFAAANPCVFKENVATTASSLLSHLHAHKLLSSRVVILRDAYPTSWGSSTTHKLHKKPLCRLFSAFPESLLFLKVPGRTDKFGSHSQRKKRREELSLEQHKEPERISVEVWHTVRHHCAQGLRSDSTCFARLVQTVRTQPLRSLQREPRFVKNNCAQISMDSKMMYLHQSWSPKNQSAARAISRAWSVFISGWKESWRAEKD